MSVCCHRAIQTNETYSGPAGSLPTTIYSNAPPAAVATHYDSRDTSICSLLNNPNYAGEINRSVVGPAGLAPTVLGEPTAQQLQSVEALRQLAPPPYAQQEQQEEKARAVAGDMEGAQEEQDWS